MPDTVSVERGLLDSCCSVNFARTGSTVSTCILFREEGYFINDLQTVNFLLVCIQSLRIFHSHRITPVSDLKTIIKVCVNEAGHSNGIDLW